MNPTEATAQIESPEFSALVNVASSYQVFLRLVATHEAVKALLGGPNQASLADGIEKRVKVLVQAEPQDGVEHPHDAALAAYLWVLGEKSAPQAAAAAEWIHQGKNLHWARRVAEKLPNPAPPISVPAPESFGAKTANTTI